MSQDVENMSPEDLTLFLLEGEGDLTSEDLVRATKRAIRLLMGDRLGSDPPEPDHLYPAHGTSPEPWGRQP